MLNIKKDLNGRAIVPKTTLESDSAGEVEVLSSDGAEYYHNGSTRAKVVTDSHSATLTNKTFNANGTGNTLSNVETADLASGVLNTSTSLAAASDTQVPSALAVKTYVDNSSGDVQADVDDLIVLSGVAAGANDLGTFTGTTIPDNSDNKEAFQALETAGETNATNLANHISDATDAHDASAISVVASGNLAATDAQSAFDELQGDIDTINTTSLAAKVTGPASATDEAIARFDSTTGKLIQNSVVTITDAGIIAGATGLTSSGTIASTGTLDIQSIITESIVSNGSATGSNATINGLTGPVIRLTNASLASIDLLGSTTPGRVLTLINSTGNNITVNNDTGSTAGQRILTGTKANITLNDEASLILKYDSVESRWMVIGGTGSAVGSQSLDVIFQLYGDENIGTWATGDNATFLGGGTIAGTFAYDTTTPLNGVQSYKYTQASGSANDYMASPVQSVPIRFRGNTATVIFPYLYNGNNSDITLVVYDVTNSTVLTNSTINALSATATNTSIYKANVVIPSTCTQLRVGFQTLVENSGKILQFDDVQLTSDATVYAELTNITDWQSYTPTGTFVTNTTYSAKWRRVGDSMEIQGRIAFTGSPGTVTTTTLTVPTGYTIDTSKFTSATQFQNLLGTGTYHDNAGGTTRFDVRVYNDTTTTVRLRYLTSNFSSVIFSNVDISNTAPVTAASSNYIEATFRVPILGWSATSSNIITASDSFSTDTASLVYASSSSYTLSTLTDAPIGTFITYTYAASTNTRTQTTTAPTQTTSSMNIDGFLVYQRSYTVLSTAAQPVAFGIQIGKGFKGLNLDVYKTASKVTGGTLDFVSLSVTNAASGMAIKSYDATTGILIIDAGYQPNQNTAGNFVFNDATTQSSGYLVVNASKSPALVGVPQVQPRFATISDQKSSGTVGGTFTSGAWQTRTLNTLVDTSGIVTTLASNQFILSSGEYYIEGSAPAVATDRHQTKIRNITDSTDSLIGTSERATAGTTDQTRSFIQGTMIITSAKTFELQHRCETTASFGTASGFSVSEVYATLRITKVK